MTSHIVYQRISSQSGMNDTNRQLTCFFFIKRQLLQVGKTPILSHQSPTCTKVALGKMIQSGNTDMSKVLSPHHEKHPATRRGPNILGVHIFALLSALMVDHCFGERCRQMQESLVRHFFRPAPNKVINPTRKHRGHRG